MRIGGYGSGGSGFRGNDDRSSAFRQGRRPGQKVRGRVLKRLPDGLSWVEIDGHRLLARLNAPYPEGTWLTFRIRQLTPEIVLSEIFEPRSGSLPRLETAAGFEAARAPFEARFHPHAAALSACPPADRPAAFLALLETDGPLLAAYRDTLVRAGEITRLLPAGHRLLHQPWLVPEARRQATIVRTPAPGDAHAMTTALVECELDGCGLVRAEFLHKDGETGYRLKLQRPEARTGLRAHLESHLASAFGSLRCLGVGKLSPREHGGIIAELLFTT